MWTRTLMRLIAAATTLSLSEDQRLRYVVSCQTLQDCQVRPRFAR